MLKRKATPWEWYSVKLLFESIISGEPDNEVIDENYCDTAKLYEEKVLLVRAQSFDHAYRVAERSGKTQEMTYNNHYNQTVHCCFVRALDCCRLFDSRIKSGTEVYFRLYRMPVDKKTDDVIESLYPETLQGEDVPLFNFLINE